MNDLDRHRIRSHLIFIVLLWLHVPLNIAVFLLVGSPWILLGAATIACAALATATWRLASSQFAIRTTNAVALMVSIALLLAGMKGNPWQVDIHMYFFAALALVAVYCDSYVIVAAAAVVAVHHLILNFVLPSAVYPGGSDFGRVVLHAVILVMEAAGLVWMSQMLQAVFRRASEAVVTARHAQAAAEAAGAELGATQAAERTSAAKQKEYQNRVLAEQNEMVSTLADRLARIANGDLTARIEEGFGDQFQQIKLDFNAAVSKLELAIQDVAEGTRGVTSGTENISTASEDLSRSTEQQAASLEETAAALDEVTATVRRSAQGASRAHQVVYAANEDAKKSAVVVRQAIEAMNAISKSSQQITQIIGVIDEIAFQTNLLALNAGVEAARAGDSGRGFAVVASEVRALAKRSAEAAKEIKDLISKSTSQVDQGAKLVVDTGHALRRIADQVVEINSAVFDIANSSKEQETALGEINISISQMNQLTQKNATMAVEATTATRSLSMESEKLSGLVRQFEVGAARGEEAMRREPKRAAPLSHDPHSPLRRARPAASRDMSAAIAARK